MSGRTRDLNKRESAHKTSSFNMIVSQFTCRDSILIERAAHFLLNKYRITSNREWFDAPLKTIKHAIEYAKKVMEANIDFNKNNLFETLDHFVEEFKENNNDDSDDSNIEEVSPPIFTAINS